MDAKRIGYIRQRMERLLSIARAVGILVGAATAIGTAVKWIQTGSLGEALSVVLPWVGRTGVVLGVLSAAWGLIAMVWLMRESPTGVTAGRIAWAAFSTYVIVSFWLGGPFDSVSHRRSADDQILSLVGALFVVVLAVVFAVKAGPYLWENRPQSKTCPDCAEKVKRAARVCMHCSYRFADPPTDTAA